MLFSCHYVSQLKGMVMPNGKRHRGGHGRAEVGTNHGTPSASEQRTPSPPVASRLPVSETDSESDSDFGSSSQSESGSDTISGSASDSESHRLPYQRATTSLLGPHGGSPARPASAAAARARTRPSTGPPVPPVMRRGAHGGLACSSSTPGPALRGMKPELVEALAVQLGRLHTTVDSLRIRTVCRFYDQFRVTTTPAVSTHAAGTLRPLALTLSCCLPTARFVSWSITDREVIMGTTGELIKVRVVRCVCVGVTIITITSFYKCDCYAS